MNTEDKNVIVAIVTSPDPKGYFGNGLHQNAFYLYRLLERCSNVTPLLAYSPLALADPTDAPDFLDVFGIRAYNIDVFKEKYHLDAMLLVSVAFSERDLEPFRKNGVKIAAVVYGNRYVMDQESICFGHLDPPANSGQRNYADIDLLREDCSLDAVWLSPHFHWQSDYIRHRYNAKRSWVCPYIWDQELLSLKYKTSGLFDEKSVFFHKGNPANKNVFCTEPNINVLKTSLFPFYVANRVHTDSPDKIDKTVLYNSDVAITYNRKLNSYLSFFPAAKDRSIIFAKRQTMPTITRDGQVMFHHHFENGLNYTLLEAATLRLPIVHNSEFMPELGYYYHRANITQAVKQLTNALAHEERHDLAEYNDACQDVIHKFSIDNKSNQLGYSTLLANLLDDSYEPELPDYINELSGGVNNYISPLG